MTTGESNGAKEGGEVMPVAWRVRGYNQFKTGTPLPWRYFDGAERPKVNDPDCCDIEPLFSRSAGGKVEAPSSVAQQWRGLTKDEIDHEVGQLVEYGTEFVAPLYAVVEGIERKLRERNAGVGLPRGGDQ